MKDHDVQIVKQSFVGIWKKSPMSSGRNLLNTMKKWKVFASSPTLKLGKRKANKKRTTQHGFHEEKPIPPLFRHLN